MQDDEMAVAPKDDQQYRFNTFSFCGLQEIECSTLFDSRNTDSFAGERERKKETEVFFHFDFITLLRCKKELYQEPKSIYCNVIPR